MVTKEQVMDALRQVVDPEIGLNIVELGLVYGVEISDNEIHITMTLTTPGCPMHESLATWVWNTVRQLDITKGIKVDLVWEPRWTPEKMSDEAKRKLGYI